MALITCKDCGKEFSTDTKRCPHCGAKKPKVAGKLGCLPMVAIGIMVLLALLSIQPQGRSGLGGPSDSEIAPQMCQRFVKESLHDPDSAEFDLWTDYYREKLAGGVYRVQVSLRAKNGFNALRKMVVDCRVKRTSSTEWGLVGLKELK